MNTDNIRGKSRLHEVSKKLFIEYRKTLLMTVVIYLGLWAVIGIWAGISGNLTGEGTIATYVLIAGFACAVAASLTFNDLCTKEGRIAFLMTPGTALDKFIPRVAVTVIGMIILCLAGYYILIFSNILAYGLRTSEWVSVNINWPDISTTDNFYLGIMALLSLFLFSEALYVFGSATWPNKSFLKTTGIFIGLQILLNMSALLTWDVLNLKLALLDFVLVGWIVTIVMLLLDASLFFWAYKQIQRKQVI